MPLVVLTISDFVAYGMEPEIMGRIGQCVPAHALTADDLARILLESSRSAYLVYQRFFSSRGVDLALPPVTRRSWQKKPLPGEPALVG